MAKQNLHPGVFLNDLLDERGLSQRELASRLDIANSLLSNILNGNRPININLAISLQAIDFKTADFWLTKQMTYELDKAQNDEEIIKRQESIKNWNDIENIVPVNYLKKHNLLQNDYLNNLKELFNVYNVSNIKDLKVKVESYSFKNFRKSSKFTEDRNNVIAWSLLAEYKASKITVKPFDANCQEQLISELNSCFLKNKDTLKKVKKILTSYGIKFFTLDRPSQTPVDGKSFMCGDSPTIVLSLKYSRLDNFAFTLMHEIGHIFLHLIKPKYHNQNFFVNAPNLEIEEKEADNFAQNNLIPFNYWREFVLENYDFDDEVIDRFSKIVKVHPAIVFGRICYEYPEYYRRRSIFKSTNVLT